MNDKESFEKMILEAIVSDGDLTTIGAENGVEIDGHGPQEGNSTPIEGYYRFNGRRAYFAGKVTVELETFEHADDDDDLDDDEGDEEE
ncbi:hypothetical protein HOT31_gp131 [Microbacterium phage Hendrix]|uniref:Uncharacterized protein n=1 Tax=Microbacterium phage Hendrix TaxID=2182341 RepID=A0A2U8UUC9_9CAUD|nr:hypothetical protein HOT31_gp131 [Microbacterium phage Hendrix]AWN07801.1 hypothetical protein PBI_HENDRIX_130 [Microbacterium phage Hendrix]